MKLQRLGNLLREKTSKLSRVSKQTSIEMRVLGNIKTIVTGYRIWVKYLAPGKVHVLFHVVNPVQCIAQIGILCGVYGSRSADRLWCIALGLGVVLKHCVE